MRISVSEPSFHLRELTADDLPATLEVYQDCNDFLALGPALASAEMVRQDMRHAVEHGRRFCGIFDPSGQMVGVVDYLVEGYEDNPQQAFIELLMIGKQHRNQRLGTAVVAEIEAEIRQHAQVICIRAGVQVNNPAAQRFWQKMGYQIVREPEFQPDGTTTYRLLKRLPGTS